VDDANVTKKRAAPASSPSVTSSTEKNATRPENQSSAEGEGYRLGRRIHIARRKRHVNPLEAKKRSMSNAKLRPGKGERLSFIQEEGENRISVSVHRGHFSGDS